MNSHGLARLYDRLTPQERLPLLVAAGARGDVAERDRLLRSAPTVGFRIPDYYGWVEGLHMAAEQYLLTQLSTAGTYWQALMLLAEERGRPAGVQQRRQEARLGRIVKMLAYAFVAHADGWQQFCAELRIDPDAVLRDFPGYDLHRQTDQSARPSALTRQEATAMRRQQGSADAEVVTAEIVARRLHERLRQFSEWWS